jgi:hypothetical protein
MTWEPADALRRIAFLLERSRAGTYRVKAFRGAAATAAATDPEQLRARARAGTLADLPGIGPATEATPCGRRCAETCTATPTGPTVGRRSRRWC